MIAQSSNNIDINNKSNNFTINNNYITNNVINNLSSHQKLNIFKFSLNFKNHSFKKNKI